MKTIVTLFQTMAAVSVTSMFLTLAGRAYGEAAPEKYKTFNGRVVKVDDEDGIVTARGFWFWTKKDFSVGDGCKVLIGDRSKEATLQDLAPGNQIEVQYSSVGGVNVARRIAGTYDRFTGHIVALDPKAQKLTVEKGLNKKPFVLGENHRVVVREKKAAMRDLKIGDQVTVAYFSVRDSNVACEIAQNSKTFSGTVEAIDAETRMLKAEHLMTDHTFRLTDDCPIVINGKAGGQLSDLRIGDTVTFNYDNVDGVMVANRIALETEARQGEQSKATYPDTK